MKNKKIRYIIYFVIILLFISYTFRPRTLYDVLDEHDLILDFTADIAFYKVDLLTKPNSDGSKITYLIAYDDIEKMNNLCEYFNTVKIRKVSEVLGPDYSRANPIYFFQGAIAFTIRGNQLMSLMNKNGNELCYVNPDGFDIEKIKEILEY